jgi:hypothetical protein
MCSGERSGVGVEQDPLGQNMSLRSVVVGFAVNATGQHQKLLRRSLNDVVSRNITMVLENLLKNYESSQLPTHGRGSIVYLTGVKVGVEKSIVNAPSDLNLTSLLA